MLTEEQKAKLREASIALVAAAGYRGAGTVEYLYQPRGPDVRVHGGKHPAPGRAPGHRGHHRARPGQGPDPGRRGGAARGGRRPRSTGTRSRPGSTPRTPTAGFAPAPGTVDACCNLPAGPGIRVDTGIAAGEVISPDYDSMVAKVIAWGRDRPEALARLRCALRETTVLIEGGTTTKSFLLDVLSRPEVVSGEADTQWLDRVGAEMAEQPAQHADIALLSVAINVYDDGGGTRAGVVPGLRPRRPAPRHARHRPQRRARLPGTDLHLGGVTDRPPAIPGRGRRTGPPSSTSTGSTSSRADWSWRERRHQVSIAAGTGSYLVEVDGVSHRVIRDEAGIVRSPAPAVVVAVPVSARRRGRGRGDGGGPREHEDGDRRAGPAGRRGPRGPGRRSTPRSTPGRRWCGWTRATRRHGGAGRSLGLVRGRRRVPTPTDARSAALVPAPGPAAP